jgi:LysR family glycine cleavage system transcriptional activator
MRRLPPLNPLVAFEASSRCGSFTKAAHELSVTQGAVSRQIAVLEEFFGRQMFERRNKEIVLTAGAAAYAEAVQDAFEQLRAATDAYISVSATAPLTIKGYNLCLNRWLIPRLHDFSLRHRSIDVRLVATSGAVPADFAGGCIDVEIRHGAGAWPGLDAHLLFGEELIPVCAPVFARKMRLFNAADLVGKGILRTRSREDDWCEWARRAGLDVARLLSKARSLDSVQATYQSAIEGEGIALIQRTYLEADLASGRLVTPFGPVVRRCVGHYLVYPSERARVPQIMAFRDWILGVDDAAAGTRS